MPKTIIQIHREQGTESVSLSCRFNYTKGRQVLQKVLMTCNGVRLNVPYEFAGDVHMHNTDRRILGRSRKVMRRLLSLSGIYI